ACGKGSGRSNVPSTTEKMAVFAPIPSARVMIAIDVKPGFFASWRSAMRNSFIAVGNSRVRLIFSFAAERFHRVDQGGAACRKHAGDKRDNCEQNRARGE